MFNPTRNIHPLINIINDSLMTLPEPINLSIWWNFGSLLGLCLIIQLITGIFLAIHYIPHVDHAFSSINHICRDVNLGWLLRNIHANSASAFFFCIYIHIGRGLYYESFFNLETWNTGIVILILTIATAFLGYVLPWGQISFWGATVITNLFSAIPYLGESLVQWLWGGFAVSNPTLNRFYTLHFLFPFIIAACAVLHLIFLHQAGSNNPLGISSDNHSLPFHVYYTIRDLPPFIVLFWVLLWLALFYIDLLGDPENFIPADPLVTPVHIKPEWYFLWAYAILRSIPNNLGGVIAIFAAILILIILPIINSPNNQSLSFYTLNQTIFWALIASVILLTWIGGQPVEAPFETLGQVFTISYFSLHLINPPIRNMWDIIIFHKNHN